LERPCRISTCYRFARILRRSIPLERLSANHEMAQRLDINKVGDHWRPSIHSIRFNFFLGLQRQAAVLGGQPNVANSVLSPHAFGSTPLLKLFQNCLAIRRSHNPINELAKGNNVATTTLYCPSQVSPLLEFRDCRIPPERYVSSSA